MAVNEPPIPDNVRAAFLSVLDVPANGPVGKPVGQLLGLPVFVLSTRDLAGGNVASRAKRVGWQVLSSSDTGGTISGELPEGALAGVRRVASRLQGPAVERAWSVYRQAIKLDQVLKDDYDPRILRIPGLHLEVFWLRHKPDQPNLEQLDLDYIVAFHTFELELSAQAIVSMREFLRIARPLADQKRGFGIPRD